MIISLDRKGHYLCNTLYKEDCTFSKYYRWCLDSSLGPVVNLVKFKFFQLFSTSIIRVTQFRITMFGIVKVSLSKQITNIFRNFFYLGFTCSTGHNKGCIICVLFRMVKFKGLDLGF